LRKKIVHRILRFSLLDQASDYNFKKLLEVYDDEMGNTKLHWLTFRFWSHNVHLQPL